MCGITGYLRLANVDKDAGSQVISQMMDAISHRGPDDSGKWVDMQYGIALGFRRLAILDLSPAGHQPMVSASGRYVMIFNGEVYNYNRLRTELEMLGARFRGTSDTEVMLAAMEAWGIKESLQRFNGMFAIGVWDMVERTLTLARDRLGIKPLYYGVFQHTLLFASELKAFRRHPSFQANIDRSALTLYLRHNYIPAPYSIYTGVQKLLPGCFLTIRSGGGHPVSEPVPYWSASEMISRGIADPFTGSDQEILEIFQGHLLRSVKERMVSDVPLGAFLSGGIDSSTIVALMQAQSSRPVRTFTIGFEEEGFNEAEHARRVARHLGTDHTELYVTPEHARSVIPRLPSIYDEPFADSSQIPTYLVSQLARQHVTVSLSGDGGDELFGGYNRYFLTQHIWNAIAWLPHPTRRALSSGLKEIAATGMAQSLSATRLPNAADKLDKLADILTSSSPSQIYLDLVSHWKIPSGVVLDGHEPTTRVTDVRQWPVGIPLPQQMMAIDLISYLPDDILAKVDRASMAVSLEARAPFLDDYETVEMAWRLPLHLKIRRGTGKVLLRQLVYKYIPRTLLERPKMGFGVPIDRWLRGPLRQWANDLLSEERLRREGYFHAAPIQAKWQEHLSGRRNWQYYLWDVLIFQSWLDAQGVA